MILSGLSSLLPLQRRLPVFVGSHAQKSEEFTPGIDVECSSRMFLMCFFGVFLMSASWSAWLFFTLHPLLLSPLPVLACVCFVRVLVPVHVPVSVCLLVFVFVSVCVCLPVPMHLSFRVLTSMHAFTLAILFDFGLKALTKCRGVCRVVLCPWRSEYCFCWRHLSMWFCRTTIGFSIPCKHVAR